MKYKLQDLIDMKLFQNLQERLNEIYNFPSAIIDNEGNILTATGWQDICTEFHRKNKECEMECIKSDQYILSRLNEASSAVSYQCPHGLVDNAIPVIIDGVHYGNFFTGQFFLEKPDLEFFREQAKKYGFDEDKYIETVKKVPVWTQAQLDSYLHFIEGLITIISESGLKKLKDIEIKEQIKKSEERANAILSEMHDGFWIVNPRGGWIIETNEAISRMLGYTRDELLKMKVADIEAKDSAVEIENTINKTILSGSSQFDSKFRRKDGSIFDVEVSITYLPNLNLIFSFHRDITRRKEAEKALLESKVLLDQSQKIAHVGSWELDLTANKLTWSDETYRIFGLEPQEFAPSYEAFLERVHPEDRTAVDTAYRESVREGKICYEIEHRIIRKVTGEIRHVQEKCDHIRDINGVIVRSVGMVQDVTERKRTEKALLESEAFTKAVLDNLPVGIAVNSVDPTVIFSYMNDNFLKFYRTTREKLANPDAFWEAVYGQPELSEKIRNMVLEDCASGDPERMHWENIPIIRKGEPETFINARNIPIPDKRLMISMVWDVTERKRVEEALRESEENMRYIIKYDPNDIAILDLNMNYIAVSDRFIQDYNIHEEHIIGKNHYEMFPEIPQRWRDVHQRSLAGEIIRNDDDYFIRPDGSITYNRWESRPWYRSDGEIGGIILYTEVTTERKLAEIALRESEERYRSLFENAPVGIFTTSSDGKKLTVNPALAHILGLSSPVEAEEHYTDFFSQLWIWTESKDTFVSLLKEKGSVENLEYEARTADNRNIWLQMSARVSEYIADGVFIIDGFSTDITQRKLSEIALQASEERLKRAQKIAQVGNWEIDLITKKVWASEESFRIYGIERINDELPLDMVQESVLPEYRPALDIALKRLTANESDYDEEFLIKQLNTGNILYLHSKAELVLTQDGRPWKVIGAVQNITERKQAEEALRESEERYRIVADWTYDWEMWSSPEGRLIYLSPSVERITGFKVEEFLSDPDLVNRIVHSSDKEKWDEHVRNWHSNSHEVAEITFRIITGSGNIKWLQHICRSVFGNDDKLLGKRITNRDITENKHAEEVRLKLLEQLQQSQKMESVGRLAGGVAHDFNNILTVILSNAEIALMTLESNNPLTEELNEIKSASERAADLTSKLLAFARKQPVNPVVLDLNETVSGILKMLGRLIGENIKLIWKPGPDLWNIKMDASQVDQILANLSVNARDAINGAGSLTIETKNVVFDETYTKSHSGFIPGKYVMLAVSDTGAGMNKETLVRLFEPFFTTKETGKGTGLGLATVYGTVKQNNGFINVYSEPGQGTTFKIYLPKTNEMAVQPLRELKKLSLGTETLILAEDEESILQLGKDILSGLGYKVLAAKTPGKAIELANNFEGPIDLLITDVVMPEMNGKELRDLLKQRYPNMKTLFMSGYTADIIAHHGVLDEGIQFLQKPFSIKTLASKVREVLDM